jgi:D-serine deaminase-like pyridoxal phosphate-dependent protein
MSSPQTTPAGPGLALETPALLLDESRMERNIARMRARIAALGVTFRPHVKTNKCIEVARRILGSPEGPITVSTLHEAEYFAGHGVRDILYAVAIAPNKLAHVAALLARGLRITLILDSVEAARQVADFTRRAGVQFAAMIEIDCDGHRSGLAPAAAELLPLGKFMHENGITLAGVMTHAGSSYNCTSTAAITAMAEQERLAVVSAAARLRAAGLPCPVVSVGSTPTALFAASLEGVTEVRAGVFVFFDLVMAGLGVCATDDIALSVLTSVIGHQRDKGWTIIDAGWMAMSRDRGTSSQPLDQGYGLVCDAAGRVLPDYIVAQANQEHGIIAHRSGDAARALDLPVGAQLRILPNHACATGAQYAHYTVIGAGGNISATWARSNGW